jgi:catechol 2,3-dioxygenase-like lactoylglutathione lyase family enzyme
MDMKLEVVVIPVSDVDRAKDFYTARPDRPDWYADYLVREQAGSELPQ